MNLEGYTPGTVAESELQVEDRWVLSRLATTVREVTTMLDRYQFDQATRARSRIHLERILRLVSRNAEATFPR